MRLKKTLSLLAVLAMIFSVVCISAFAEETVNEGNAAFTGDNVVFDGTNYYTSLSAAVEAVNGKSGAVLYCKKDASVGTMNHAPVTATLTIYGNGATVDAAGEQDFDIGNTDPSYGKDVKEDMTLTVYNLNGCGAWGAKATDHTVSLVFEGCKKMGKVFITGTTGTLNISLNDCSFIGDNIKESVYSNADGTINLNNVAFSNVNKAINLNHKAAGKQTVILTNCTFNDCGNDVANDQIPVRILSSVEGGVTEATITGCSFSGTPEGGADILVDYAKGTTTADISGTAAVVAVEKENNAATTSEISVTDTVSVSNVEKVVVAKIGEEEFETLQAAIDAVKEGDTIVLLDDIEITSGANGTTNGISYTRDASFNIDLNGKTVSSNLGNNALRFKIGGDGTAVTGAATINVYNGKVVSGADNWCAISAAGTSDTARLTLNLKDLIVENSKGGDYAVKAWEYAKVTAENVTVNSTYGGGVYAAGGEVVLNDNVVVNQKGLWNKPYLSMAVAVSTKGKVTVNSGTYTTEPLTAEEAENQGSSHGSWAAGVMNSGGTLIINGGTFANGNYGDDSLATAARGMILADTYAVVEINGGTFNSLKGVIDYQNNLGVAEGNPVVTIKGGTYSANPIGGYVELPEGYSNIKDFKGNYVIGVAPTATVNNLGSTVIKAGEYRNLSFQTVYDKDMPLSFVMQFLANQTAEDMVTSPYADWYGDFVITFTGIEAGSFEATGCYLAGYYGDFGWIQVPVDDMIVHNGVRYPVMLGYGAGQKYDYICESVKDFRCAMYLTPEILENNPNIKVSLELSVVDNSAGSDAALDALVSGDESVIHKVGVNEYVAEDFVIKEEVLPTEVYVLYNDTPLTVPESIQEKYDYEEGYKVRLYAGIDKLSYKDLGFMAKLVDPTKNYETDWVEFALEKKVVYKEITVTTKEKTETLTPEMFPIAGSGVELNYLFPMNIWVPSGDDGYSAETYLIVRPFSRAFDGTTVLGESYQTEAIGK